MNSTRLPLSIAAILLALVFGGLGCEDDPTRPHSLPEATNPDELAELLAKALGELDFQLYASLLHDDFQFEFAGDERILSGTSDGRWTLPLELESMESLLSGSPNRRGEVIVSIDASLSPQGDAWTAAVDPDLAGSQQRRYALSLDIVVADGTVYQARAFQDLFVIEDDASWKLLYHSDLGVIPLKASVAPTTMSRLKSSYAAVDPFHAVSPDRFIDLFMHALNTRDFQLYESLLHEDYEFQFAADECDLSGAAICRWPRTRDLASMQRLMGGSPSRDGEVVQDVDLDLAARSASWSDIVEPEFTGTQRRGYTVRMDVSVSGGTIYQVRGMVEFYVEQVGDIWQLRFHRDNGIELTMRSTEGTSYGAMKSRY